jgi:hypothetical protein
VWRLVLLVLVLLVGVGCGKHAAAVAAEAMADAVCACDDVPCAALAHRRGLAEVLKHTNSRGSRDDEQAITAAGKRLQECQRELQARQR